MCTNKRWILNPYNHKKYFVECGKCLSCQQKKANRNAAKIRNNRTRNVRVLMVNLTYANDCVPYIRKSEVALKPVCLNVYRDSVCRLNPASFNGVGVKSRSYRTVVLDTLDDLDFPLDNSYIDKLPIPTNIDDQDKVSVIYFKDFQDYIKRLKEYVKYHYASTPLDKKRFSFYVAAEYGEENTRCHFHVLFFVDKDCVELWKSAISKNWQFDDNNNTYRNIREDYCAASYLAAYLNKFEDIPKFLLQKKLAPRKSHSLHFGFGLNEFKLDEVVQAIERRDLRYDCVRTIPNAAVEVITVPYPRYVISRFFPKFKGYCRLTDAQIQSVLRNPRSLSTYAQKLDYDDELLHATITHLTHARDYFYNYFVLSDFAQGVEPGYSIDDYARLHIDCWKLVFKNQMILQYDDGNPLYKYDNLLLCGHFSRETLNSFVYDDNFNLRPDVITDPNQYPDNVIQSRYYEDVFYNRAEKRRVNNIIFPKYGKYLNKSKSQGKSK